VRPARVSGPRPRKSEVTSNQKVGTMFWNRLAESSGRRRRPARNQLQRCLEPLELRTLLSAAVAPWTETYFGPDVQLLSHVMERQDDGKVLVLTTTSPYDWKLQAQVPSGSDFGLARYNVDGSLDTAFGDGGFVRVDFFNGGDHASDLAVAPDGKIVLIGIIVDAPGSRPATATSTPPWPAARATTSSVAAPPTTYSPATKASTSCTAARAMTP
jgi:hypothetical protein